MDLRPAPEAASERWVNCDGRYVNGQHADTPHAPIAVKRDEPCPLCAALREFAALREQLAEEQRLRVIAAEAVTMWQGQWREAQDKLAAAEAERDAALRERNEALRDYANALNRIQLWQDAYDRKERELNEALRRALAGKEGA